VVTTPNVPISSGRVVNIFFSFFFNVTVQFILLDNIFG